MSKELTLIHYKNYDKVRMNVINRKNCLAAAEMKRKNDREATSISVSKKAFADYKNVYREEMKILDTPIGSSFEIMGVTFKKIDNLGVNDRMVWLETDNSTECKDKVKFGIFPEQTLLGEVFKSITGTLLFC